MRAETAAMIMMSGSADLEDITINENGEYESVDHDGFGVVTVEVPTMVECAEEVAEILGVDTSQEWDCDDIKAKAQEVVDENEEMQECCDEVLDVIHDYDPTYDPHPDPPDPTNPTIPEKIQEIIDEESGYTLPDGTDPSDPNIQTIVAGNPVTDNNTGVTIGTDTYQNPDNSWGVKPYYIIDGTKTYMPGVDGGTAVAVRSFSDIVLKVTDPTTGEWEGSALVTWDHPFWTPTTFNYNGVDPALVGYGDTSHTYTVRNN
jgi:hypothetical protein